MIDEARPGDTSTVRSKADQDLAGVRARIIEAEAKLMDLRGEERELLAFIRRLDRYDPRPESSLLQGLSEQVGRDLVAAAVGTKVTPPAGLFRGPRTARFFAMRDPAVRRPDDMATVLPIIRMSAATAEPALMAAEHPLADGEAVLRHNSPRAFFASPQLPSVPRRGTRRARVNDEVLRILDLLGAPQTTKTLVAHIRSDSEVYGFLGARPEATLSSYLSRDPRFRFDRDAGGWMLNSDFVEGPADQDGVFDMDDEDEGSVST